MEDQTQMHNAKAQAYAFVGLIVLVGAVVTALANIGS